MVSWRGAVLIYSKLSSGKIHLSRISSFLSDITMIQPVCRFKPFIIDCFFFFFSLWNCIGFQIFFHVISFPAIKWFLFLKCGSYFTVTRPWINNIVKHYSTYSSALFLSPSFIIAMTDVRGIYAEARNAAFKKFCILPSKSVQTFWCNATLHRVTLKNYSFPVTKGPSFGKLSTDWFFFWKSFDCFYWWEL